VKAGITDESQLLRRYLAPDVDVEGIWEKFVVGELYGPGNDFLINCVHSFSNSS
tara:strand:+ start:2230 stop:2391 length:162 start_codon:yes stop_codon:yes gene_type:complete